MLKRILQSTVVLSALFAVSSLQAHHSNSLFDMSTYIWLKGTVVSYEPIAPHAMVELEELTEGGQVRRWTVEGPNPIRLGKLDVDDNFIKPGDVIEVCGFFLKSDTSRNNSVHAHVLIMPDGKKWRWGPYGRLASCVNSNDWDSLELGRPPLRVN